MREFKAWRIRGQVQHLVILADCRFITTPPEASTLVFDPPWDAESPYVPDGAFSSRLVFTGGRYIGSAVKEFGPPTWQFVWDCKGARMMTGLPLMRHKSCLWYGNERAYDGTASTLEERSQGDRAARLGDLYSHPLSTLVRKVGHSHAKPVEWVQCLLANCTRGEIFDPYLGSGTTLIAGNNLGRRVVGVENDEAAVRLTLERARAEGMISSETVVSI